MIYVILIFCLFLKWFLNMVLIPIRNDVVLCINYESFVGVIDIKINA